MRVEVSEVATPKPAEIMSPGVKLPRVPPKGLFPFLSLGITEDQMTDMTRAHIKGFKFSLSVLIGAVYCRLRGQHDSKGGEITASAHDDEDELCNILSLAFLYKNYMERICYPTYTEFKIKA